MVVFVVKLYAVPEAKKWRYAVRNAKIERYAVRKGRGGCHPHLGVRNYASFRKFKSVKRSNMQYILKAKGGTCVLSSSIDIMFEHVRLRHKDIY